MIGRKRVLLGTLIGWRPAFGILIAVSALVLLLSFRLKPDEGRPERAIQSLEPLTGAYLYCGGSCTWPSLPMWTRKRQTDGKTPLLDLQVIDSPQEGAAVYAMFR